MAWRSIATLPIDIDTGIAAARALAIAEALARRAVPLLAARNGRAEPLATAALYLHASPRGVVTLLVTCRHIFDAGVAVGDLGVPLGDAGAIFWLRSARVRVLEHPVCDLAVLAIGEPHAAALLRRHWRAEPLGAEAAGRARNGADGATHDAATNGAGEATIVARPSNTYVIAGYPYAQMRRIDATVYARPVVLFARAAYVDQAELRLTYRHLAQRVDGTLIYAPELDGVSGATLWAVRDLGGDGVACLLAPVGVQCAFKHSAYVRAEPWSALAALARHLRAGSA
jgi:hypothetical protein